MRWKNLLAFSMITSLSTSALAGETDLVIEVIGYRYQEVSWDTSGGGWDWGWDSWSWFGGSYFDGGGGGGGDFSLELPPDCSVELCMDPVEGIDQDAVDAAVAEAEVRIEAIVSQLDATQIAQLTPIAYTAAYELDYQIKIAMYGLEPNLAYAESLLNQLANMTIQFGYENGTLPYYQ